MAPETDNVIHSMHYKPTKNKTSQMIKHEPEKKATSNSNTEQRDAVKNLKIILRTAPKVLNIFLEFADMWDRNLGNIKAGLHQIELIAVDTRSIHSASYCTGPKNGEFEQREINKVLDFQIIEPAQADWASHMVFAPKKDGTFGICVFYHRLNAGTVCNVYPTPLMDECIDTLGDATIFQSFTRIAAYGKSKSRRKAR